MVTPALSNLVTPEAEDLTLPLLQSERTLPPAPVPQPLLFKTSQCLGLKGFKIHHQRVPMECASMHRKWLQSVVWRNCKLFHFKFLNQRKSKSSCFQPSRADPGIHHFCKRRTKILLGNRTRQLCLRCSGLPAALDASWDPKAPVCHLTQMPPAAPSTAK